MSDFVPNTASDLKEASGLSMVLVISLTAMGILISIIYDIACNAYKWLKIKYYMRKFKIEQIKAVKNKALQLIINMSKID